MVVAGLKPSSQLPAALGGAVRSEAPPFAVPTQVFGVGWKPFDGQAADARQIVVAGLKPSTQTPDPSQESVPSHAPPFEVPTQVVVDGWKPSAGQLALEPVQLSATSH